MTEAQLLLLSNIIYCPEFTDLARNSEKTVGQILEIARDNNTKNHQEMTPEEWTAIFDMVEKDPELLDLKVTNMRSISETGAAMACFVDANGNATAVFAGTGVNEWRDDTTAGADEDSIQQVDALTWFEGLPYTDITVAGHSKGGNKAMYVALLSDKAGECYAFDGQGFSPEFIVKYADEIAAKKQDIHLRANYRDFINILMSSVAGDIKYSINDQGVSDIKQYHCPNALFQYKNGKITAELAPFGPQDPVMKMLHNFTVYLMDHAPQGERRVAMSVLGELLQLTLGKDGGQGRADIIAQLGDDGLLILLTYMRAYMEEFQETDYPGFLEMKAALFDLMIQYFGFVKATLIMSIIDGSMPSILINAGIKILANFNSSKTTIRDFSQSTKEILVGAAKETEDEKWWDFTRWDCWYRIEQKFGGLQYEDYAGKVNEYYRKIIDINDASVSDITNIFDKAYQTDAAHATKISAEVDKIDSMSKQIQQIADSICPAM